MLRKKSPRLAAAFVVTISAGCGGSGSTTSSTLPPNPPKPIPEATGPEDPNWVPNIGSVQGGFHRNGDKCYIEHPANPPWSEPVDCETRKPLPPQADKPADPPKGDTKPADPPTADTKPTDTKPDIDLASLPQAPAGWDVKKLPNGACKAYAPSRNCPPGKRCNPPPPQTVQCPKNMPKDAADPLEL